MKEIGIIANGKPDAKKLHDCCHDLPDFSETPCGPEIPRRNPGIDIINQRRVEEDQKLIESKNGTVLKMGANRKQRRRKAKTARPGMMRGDNFTPAKKKRR